MLKQTKEVLNKAEEKIDDIEKHKFEIFAGITMTAILCMACYLTGFKDGSHRFFSL